MSTSYMLDLFLLSTPRLRPKQARILKLKSVEALFEYLLEALAGTELPLGLHHRWESGIRELALQLLS